MLSSPVEADVTELLLLELSTLCLSLCLRVASNHRKMLLPNTVIMFLRYNKGNSPINLKLCNIALKIYKLCLSKETIPLKTPLPKWYLPNPQLRLDSSQPSWAEK